MLPALPVERREPFEALLAHVRGPRDLVGALRAVTGPYIFDSEVGLPDGVEDLTPDIERSVAEGASP